MSANEDRGAFLIAARQHLAAGFPLLWWVTHEEQRGLAFARNLSQTIPVVVWSASRGFDGAPQPRSMCEALAELAARQGPVLGVFLDAHSELENPTAVRAIRDFISDTQQKALIFISPILRIPVELEKDIAVMDVPLPNQEELASLLHTELARRAIDGVSHEAMTQAAAGLTWLEAQRAFRLALLRAPDKDPVLEVIGRKRSTLRRSAALELVDTDVYLQDVGGLDVLKAWLGSRLAAFRTEARAFGLPEPRGMMVCGVQGCGKSLVAKAAARVFGIPLVRLDFAAVFASPSPELTVRQATRIAEAVAPVVLWVDEIEKGLGGSAAGQARVFGDFLVWMQEKRAAVFVAATANEVEHLPPELVRRGRFDEIFFVDLPGVQERAEILAIHIRRRGRDPSRFPLENLSKNLDHYSGAELEQLVIAAMFRAFAAGRDLQADDLRLSGKEMVPLATMYEEKVQALRTWAQARARRASADRRTLDLFED